MNLYLILTLILFFCCIGLIANSQTVSEWFQQQKTRLKYLKAQNAALTAYRATLNDGYQAEEQELDSIQSNKKAEYRLHQQYCRFLQIVNPKLKNNFALTNSKTLEDNLIDIVDKSLENYLRSQFLNQGERSMFCQLLLNLVTNIHEQNEELRALVTDNAWRLDDGERQKAIDKACEEVIFIYDYAVSKIVEVNMLIEARQETEAQMDVIKKLFP